MINHIIGDITNFIFISDEPEKVDAIFLPGGSHPEQPEYAANLYHRGFARWLVPSGGISIKCDKWPGAAQNQIYITEIINLIVNFLRMCSEKMACPSRLLSVKINRGIPVITHSFHERSCVKRGLR